MKKTTDVLKLTYLAVLTAIVVVLQFIPIRISTFELALSVPAIVIGAAICGVGAGTWLGFVFGAVVLMLPGTTAFLSLHLVGTILTVLVKGVLAGFSAGVSTGFAAGASTGFASGFSTGASTGAVAGAGFSAGFSTGASHSMVALPEI